LRTRLCLITDRRRLVAAMGPPTADSLAALRAQVAGAIGGGIDVIQIREPDLDARELIEVTRGLLALERPAGVQVIVNDRLDVALAAGADGVHLREAGMPIGRVRATVPHRRFAIGRSVHDEETARWSADADYLIAGHVFETISKRGRPALGLDGLAGIVRAAGATPVLAIGGVTKERLGRLIEAGAAGAAAIGAFIPAGPVPDLRAVVQKLTQDLRNSV
jgi:thiamine-phosphate pyrophosphorylase